MTFDTNDGAVFGIIAQHTGNLSASTAFYEHVLHWTAIKEDRQVGTFMMRDGGANPEAIFLSGDDDSGLPVGQWIPQIAVADIHAVAERCLAMGGELVVQIREVSEFDPGLMCTIRDPEGGVLGLIQVARR
jgi:predicted enzyme related to lactoylglutathione lyase